MAPSLPTHEPLANDPTRIAVDTIRAYNYQVLRSVLAWIELRDNEVLYLEGAEDFDKIQGNNAITVQVKDTQGSGNVTLRTKGVIEAISHYWGHCQRNENRNITFNYLTTSNIGMEQGDPLGQGVPGLELWEKTKTESNLTLKSLAVNNIREFLDKHKDIPQNLKYFLGNASQDDVFTRLINPMMWVTGAETSEGVKKKICDILVIHGNRVNIGADDSEKVIADLCFEAWSVASRHNDRALNRADFIRIFDKSTRISVPKSDYIDRNRANSHVSDPPAHDFTPPLPTTLIRRTAVITELKRSLLAPTLQEANASPCIALVGMPGVGKSVLAALLAHDPEVRARYPNGVLWATLGRQPDVLSLLHGWIPALGGRLFKVSAVEASSALVRGLLTTGRYLIVVDDAWSTESVEPFRVGGPDCAMILTTRDSVVARRFSVEPQQVDVLLPNEARDLLQNASGKEFNIVERFAAEQLVKVLEYLPLAIEIAGAQVADGMSVDGLKDAIGREIARLDLLDLTADDAVGTDDTARKRLSVEVSFALSLRGVGNDIVNAFAWLGVLPEDASFDANAMQTIWGLDEIADAARRLAQLRRRALLQDAANDGRAVRCYRMHDLLHDFARRLLTGNPEVTRARLGVPAYGLTLTEANEALVSRYRALVPSGCWGDLPDDSYVHQHLAYHMEHAGQLNSLDDLLHESDSNGSNAWYSARERLGQVAGFVSDLERLRHCALVNACRDPQWLGSAVSVAVIQSSLVSRAHVIPSALAVACVRHGLWTPAQGLDSARLMPPTIGRVWMLASLAPFLADRWETEIAEEAFAEATSGLRQGGMVASLGVEHYALDLLIRVLPTALIQRLVLLSDNAPVNTQVRMAAQMAPYLDEATRDRFIANITARCTPDAPGKESDKLEALAQLATINTKHFERDWDIELLTRACQSGDVNAAYNVFKTIAPLASESGQFWILHVLEETNNLEFSAGALLGFSDNLTEANRLIAIRLANQHPEPIVKYWLVGRLSCGLQEPQTLLRSCIDLIRLLPKDHRKFGAFHDLLRCAPPPWRSEIEEAAIDAGAEFGFGGLGAEPLQEFARRLSPSGLKRMAGIIVASGSDFDRTQALPALLACVDEELVPDLCRALLTTLQNSQNKATFSPFWHRIPKELLPEFLAACRIGDEGVVGETLAAAAPFVPRPDGEVDLCKALHSLQDRAQGVERVRVAAASMTKGLAKNPKETITNLINGIREVMGDRENGNRNREESGNGLLILLTLLPMSDRTKLIESLMDNEFNKISKYDRPTYLGALVRAAPAVLTDRLVAEVAKVEEGQRRAELLSYMAIRDDKRKVELFTQSLIEIKALPEEHLRHAWLKRWISFLPQQLYSEATILAESCRLHNQALGSRLLISAILPRQQRRACETKIKSKNGKELASIYDNSIEPQFLKLLSARQLRDLAVAMEGKPGFLRVVLTLDFPSNQDLYLKGLTTISTKWADSAQPFRQISFGIAAASLPTDQILPWLLKYIEGLAGIERSKLLSVLEFLWPFLDAVGGRALVQRVLQSVILAQKWWP